MAYVLQQRFAVEYSFPIHFTRAAFSADNGLLRDVVRSGGERRHRALVAVDENLLNAAPGICRDLTEYAERHADVLELIAAPFLVCGGEACKSDPVEVGEIQALIEKHRLCRQSFVLAIGGGAVLDAVGFAAATAHRGVRLIRMPTTVLAQNDAGVGVKNGINAFGRKNFLGTFAPPFAVINDLDFIDTLSERDKRSGIAEAVKVALIKDALFFDALYRERGQLARFQPEAMERMIIRCAELHVEHIGSSGDPFEFGSARPLDFGHWSAHKLEELTASELKHGEAVAIGIALDSLYSYHAGLVSEWELRRVFRLLRDLGFALHHRALDQLDVEKALGDFREHLGGELTITLLKGIGQKVEVHDIDPSVMRRCIQELAAFAERRERRNEAAELSHAGGGGLERRVC